MIEGLFNAGGMERVITQKANWLVNNTDYAVTIITFCQVLDKPDFYPLDFKVNRVKWNINISNFYDELQGWLKNNPQDICISTYGREFEVLPKIHDGSKKIVEFHFCYDINKKWMSNHGFSIYSKVMGFLKTVRMVHISKKYDRIVVLTNRDLKKWNNPKVVKIYNPQTILPSGISSNTSKRIIALGRMDKQKGFDYLIDCWSLLENKYSEWQLDIFGSGNTSPYNEQILRNNLKNIHFHPPVADVCQELLSSSIYVLSSRYEGFSLTICEAMSCGLPIVAFDCPSGPSELVENGKNGFIINRVGDIKSMASKLSLLIENEQLRKDFGLKSYSLSRKYQINEIMQKWIKLFEELTLINK